MGHLKANQLTRKTTSMKKSTKRSSKSSQKNKHGVHKVRSPTTIHCLPSEMVAEILACLATSSPVDLFRCKQSCKALLEISEEKHVLQKVFLDSLVYNREWQTEDASKPFVTRCLESDNPEALLHVGMKQYFGHMMVKEGLRNLEEAGRQGSSVAAYVLSLIHLCSVQKECIDRGLELMSNTMKEIGMEGIVECRKKLRAIIVSMWLQNTSIVESKPKISCAKQKQYEVNMSGWDGGYYLQDEKDTLVCEVCKCAREVDFFHDLLANQSVEVYTRVVQ